MTIKFEKVLKIKKCNQEGCNNLAVCTMDYKNIFSHKFCLCKKCLDKVYTNLGKILTPKSPKNIISKKMKEEKYE